MPLGICHGDMMPGKLRCTKSQLVEVRDAGVPDHMSRRQASTHNISFDYRERRALSIVGLPCGEISSQCSTFMGARTGVREAGKGKIP